MTSVSLSIDGMPDCRIVVYTPDDEESRRRTAELRGGAGESGTRNPALVTRTGFEVWS